MPLLRTNLIANLAGSMWSAALGILFVPIYVRLIGVESYGLIGFYATLQAASILFDLGLSTTINREIARLAHEPEHSDDLRDLAFTIQLLYWAGAVIVGALIIIGAPWLAEHWIHAASIPFAVVVRTLRLIGIVVALQFAFTFYSGGLLGLQRHALLNIVVGSTGTARAFGAFAVLTLVVARIDAYFAWQVVVSAIQVIAAAVVFWRALPRGGRPHAARLAVLRPIASFSVSVSVITMIGTLLTQLDKFVLTKTGALVDFGYYTLAWTAAAVLSIAAAPVFTSTFPRFAHLLAVRDDEELRLAYHRSAQVLSILIIPAGMVLITHARGVLWMWTGRADVAERAALPLALLTVGFIAGGLNQIPLALQLAAGWTRLALIVNVTVACFVVPAMIYAARAGGGAGVAIVWAALNLAYVLIFIPLVHARLLHGQALRWYVVDVGLPLAGALLVAIPSRMLFAGIQGRLATFVMLAGVGGAALVVSSLLTPYMRELFGELLEKTRRQNA